MTGRHLTGVRPTGALHLGHWFSVIKPGRAGADVLVADLHAPGSGKCVDIMRAELESYGLRPILQSWGSAAAYFPAMLALVSVNELRHLIQFKTARQDEQTAHLLTYPVLQACDCMGYDVIHVGPDQKQHIDYARDWIDRFNRRYGYIAQIPRAEVCTVSIRDLRDPARKMSKSNPAGCLFLSDAPDVKRAKIMRAVTSPDGLESLHALYREFVGEVPPASNSEMKSALADALIKLAQPVGAHNDR